MGATRLLKGGKQWLSVIITASSFLSAGNIHSNCTLACDAALYDPAIAQYTCGESGVYETDTPVTCHRRKCSASVSVPEGATSTCSVTEFGQTCAVSCTAHGTVKITYENYVRDELSAVQNSKQ
jgi:hypothetical protein